MEQNDIDVQEGQEVVRNTIVGGRPMARHNRTQKVPFGIEKVLCKAATDPSFRSVLLTQPAKALESLGDELSQQERQILDSIPSQVLTSMVANIKPEQHGAKRFMAKVLAATALASSILIMSCAESESMGIRPDGDVGPPDTGEQDVGTDWVNPLADLAETTPDFGSGVSFDISSDGSLEADVVSDDSSRKE